MKKRGGETLVMGEVIEVEPWTDTVESMRLLSEEESEILNSAAG